MRRKQIEDSLKKSIIEMTDNINNPLVKENKEMKKMKMNFNFIKATSLAVATLVIALIVGISYYDKNYVEYAKVSFDVNPSITLSANKENKIIKQISLNDDGEKILEDIDVIGMDIEKASEIIVDRLIKEGYLNTDGANILLTVENNNLKLASEAEEKLMSNINEQLNNNYIAGTVISQIDTVRKNIPNDIKKIMEEYQLSYSKSIFINNILKKNVELKIEDIANLKISEISKLINDSKIDISDIVKSQKEESLYKNKELMDAKKIKDKAEELKNKAEVELQKAKDELINDINNQSALEQAQKAKEQAESKVTEAIEKYQEIEQEQNKDTTENQEQNQNENGIVNKEEIQKGIDNSNNSDNKGR